MASEIENIKADPLFQEAVEKLMAFSGMNHEDAEKSALEVIEIFAVHDNTKGDHEA